MINMENRIREGNMKGNTRDITSPKPNIKPCPQRFIDRQQTTDKKQEYISKIEALLEDYYEESIRLSSLIKTEQNNYIHINLYNSCLGSILATKHILDIIKDVK